MLIAAALAASFLGSDALAQGKRSIDSPFGEERALPTDGNEVVDVAATWIPELPGHATSAVAITFTIDPGWHLYWKNNGDTGMPIMLDLDLPNGVTAGETLWPAPRRYVHSGGLLDYIYEGEVTLIVPIGGVSDVRPTDGRPLGKVSIEFLVCQEACIPGERTVDLAIPGEADEPPVAEAMRAVDLTRRLPRPGGAEWSWDGTTLVITTPEADDAESLVFFPEEDENVRPVNALRDGEAKGRVLRFEYRDAVRRAGVVRGVLEVRNRNGDTAFYQVQTAPPRG